MGEHVHAMTFRITFGQRYRHEPHPYLGHPDGWSEVQAENIMAAMDKARQRYGKAFACIYSPDSEMYPDKEFYPRGLIERFM